MDKTKIIRLHDRTLEMGKKTYIVGVLNITPDSLGGGFYNDINGSIKHAHLLIEDGADILEIGGESTRPGFNVLSNKEVWFRLEPVLKYLTNNVSIPISIDTYKPYIAKRALDLGAHIINDVSGLRAYPEMVRVIKEYSAGVVICRDREIKSRNQTKDIINKSNFHIIKEILLENLKFAIDNGIKNENIILDPRIGSGLTNNEPLLPTIDCIELLKNYKVLKELGQPIMSAHSLKTFIGDILGGIPVNERFSGTDAVTSYAILNGANFIRVHDVKSASMIARVIDSLNKE